MFRQVTGLICLLAVLNSPLSALGLQLEAKFEQADKPVDLKPLKALFLGDQGPHQPRQRFEIIEPLLRERGIELTYTESLTDLRPTKLRDYSCLMVYANIDLIDAEAERGLLDYVRGGGGLVALHCASYCFRNSRDVVAMIGAQFQRHGTGVFRTEIADGSHPLLKGFGGFESWDETYVHHLHNENNRTVLEYRNDEQGREPWTWIRTEGEGRVFYTAWGHDERTWTNPGFANLVERGVRWASGGQPGIAGDYLSDRAFLTPQMTEIAAELAKFEYDDVGKQIPNYTPSAQWGTQGEPFNLMQRPLAPDVSSQHISTPVGFHVELFASEPDLQGKPICMSWDERGRLWVCETVDYPNELQRPEAGGRDRIRICCDTDGDGRADRFTVFAENLSIPASLTFHRGGVIVQNGVETIYLRDNNGDDVADQRDVWFRGWNQSDTHGGVSNFQYGLDNWIWAMQGYNFSEPRTENWTYPGGFRQGFFRFSPATQEIEFLRPTNNNTWGLGITEEGLIFGSTANGNPSVFMPIPNRYYEQVAGWRTSLTLSSIADSNKFAAITDRVRQVDFHGGYTAAAGHAIYTARTYPPEYWNRTAFVCEPTGHIVAAFVLKPNGSGFRSTNLFNLVASNDEWTAPIMSEVGPDGNVWVIDWYNFIVQHNPTPQGFQTGRGAAYETKLRDKVHGRIYRVVWDGAAKSDPISLVGATSAELVKVLCHPTMLWRRHAQRLLVERADLSVVPELIELVNDHRVDEIGINVGAIHALWTLHGLGVVDSSHPAAQEAIYSALRHPSAGVRRNALQVLPMGDRSVAAIVASRLVFDPDPNVRLQAFLALADMPGSAPAATAVLEGLHSPTNYRDLNIHEAAVSAAARHSEHFLPVVASQRDLSSENLRLVAIVSEHVARRIETHQLDLPNLVEQMSRGDAAVVGALTKGLVEGWPISAKPELTEKLELNLESLAGRISAADLSLLLQLANRWGSRRLDGFASKVIGELIGVLDDAAADERERISAARQLVEFRPADLETAKIVLARITPQTEPSFARGLLQSLGSLQLDDAGSFIAGQLDNWSPVVRRQALDTLLSKRTWTMAVVELLEKGQLQISDLSLEQRTAISANPDRGVRERALAILRQGGALPNSNRQAVLDEYHVATSTKGDAAAGKKLFLASCAKCHRHGGEGQDIGPDLTGMAVHPKEELLVHILDPSRSVEGNFRMYQVQTSDGLSLSGMLGSESRTSVELIDSQGMKRVILREEIDEMRGSKLSVMPEGIEKEITIPQMTDLLEFLAQRGKWLPLDLAKVATAASDRGMFYSRDSEIERLIFPEWKDQSFKGIPFRLVDPKSGAQPNVILLRGPDNTLTEQLPREVELPINAPARAIHFLSGVSGWGFPYNPDKTVSMIAQIHYDAGEVEEHPLRNAEHFADYIRKVDVPNSEFAFQLRGQQIRYFAILPAQSKPISRLVLVKGPDQTAPIVMAITIETE